MIRRSHLFVPGTRSDRFKKARQSGADAVILDLEDAVQSTDKDLAREAVVSWLSKIVLDFLDPGGAVTGKLLPTGQVREVLHVPGIGHIDVSIVDAANPLVFCRAEDFGLSGRETPEQIDSNQELLLRIGVAIGLAESIEEAIHSVPSVPKIAFVTRSRSYAQLDGELRVGYCAC